MSSARRPRGERATGRLRHALDRLGPRFEEGRRLALLQPLFEMIDGFLYTPASVADGRVHMRGPVDLKRLMGVVVVALLPCLAMALYNTGYQTNSAIASGMVPIDDWRTSLYIVLGFDHDADDIIACTVYGALFFVPVLIAAFVGGAAVEVAFAIVRRHPINEGLLVTGFLLPMVLPPTIPLWQVALGAAVGVLLGKEVFGGTGMNFLNPALVCRAFLFFAYPAQMSGNIWVAGVAMGDVNAAGGAIGAGGVTGIDVPAAVDGITGASPLARLGNGSMAIDAVPLVDAFIGRVPGSMGETSTLACLIGAAILLAAGAASWRIMVGAFAGSALMVAALGWIGSTSNPLFDLSFAAHVVLGGLAFGAVFMATDPVSAPVTEAARWAYGLLIGALIVLLRVVNPAYPEGTMLAILLLNLFAPLLDHVVIRRNVRLRKDRYRGR